MTHRATANSQFEVPSDQVRLSVAIEVTENLVVYLQQALDAAERG